MRKIFVMGGGGFSMEPKNPLFDQYILSLANKGRPKICFIGTASGDSDSYIKKFYTAYKKLKCIPTHLALFKATSRDFKKLLGQQDIVFVGGGNTKNLLCLWKDWGLDRDLKAAYKKGLILSGISAGMICWFEEGITDSSGGIDPIRCLGFLKGSASPHFDSEKKRRPTFVKLIKNGTLKGGLGLDDGAGALFVNEKLFECVSSRKNAGAYQFESRTAKELKIPLRYLGD